jgi:hypothetical protein
MDSDSDIKDLALSSEFEVDRSDETAGSGSDLDTLDAGTTALPLDSAKQLRGNAVLGRIPDGAGTSTISKD